jgi:predicted O-methyltransferase YrrM
VNWELDTNMRGIDLRSKAGTLFWYLRRRELYPELLRRVVGARFTTAGSSEEAMRAREAGRAWSAELALPPSRLFQFLKIPETAAPLAELYAREWGAACDAVAACPVKMGGPADVDIIYHLCRYLPARQVVETGVASGWSTLAVLLAMRELGTGTLVSIDMPYAKLGNESYVGCAVSAELRAPWTLIRKPDREGLAQALRLVPSLDLAHYDSDKSYEGRTWAYERLWRALREGGVLISDDIEDNFGFRDFARSVERQPWIVEKERPGNYAGVLIK